MEHKVYYLKNLDCANCAAKIEAKFNAHPEVEEAIITFATKQLRLTAADPDALIPELTRIARTVEGGAEINPRDAAPAARRTRKPSYHHHHEHEEHHECGCGHHHEHHHHDEDCHHHHDGDGKCSCGHHHAPGHSHIEEFGIKTFVYFRRQPFARIKLDKFAENWPATVIRTKGIIWLSDDNTSAYMLEQAGRQIAAGYSGDWMATGTKAQIKDTMEADPEFKRNWDERVGDRMIKLVFIGKDMNQDKIIADLDACLVEARL